MAGRRVRWPAILCAVALAAGTASMAVWAQLSRDAVPVPGASLPGAPPLPPELSAALEARWAERDAGYRPRTRHLGADGSPRYTNRLFLESSPYLRQHAHNPVDWWPWGDAAFEAARRLGRPVLLSVGYSTCHWCHVMEEESFEDEEIARYLNENYVAVKVDREERPDVDAVYMNAVQLLTGSGGWPMTVWLTPDREPFFGGTYFPARDGDRGVRVGFLSVLRQMREVYGERPERVAEVSRKLTEAVRRSLSAGPAAAGLPSGRAIEAAIADFRARYDPAHGGLAGAPKFPSGLSVRFLLRHHRRTQDPKSLEMAVTSLERMAAGGMYDQAGGGFHRYSVDDRWRVPHFEKMLYDNALLVMAYLEGHQASGRADFARVAREVLDYVERDMTSPEGGFYSATDADSPTPSGTREEGWFFTWTPDEVRAAVGAKLAPAVLAYYGVTPEGQLEGRSVLHVARPAAEVARELGMPTAELQRVVEESRLLLLAARDRRPPPLRDEKVLAAWNGLMISAHARAGLVLGEARYLARAAAAADFVLARMREPDGRLRRSHTGGVAGPRGYLDDHAFMVAGLIDLYEATGELRWLEAAAALDAVIERLFEDAEHGGYFMTSVDHEGLLAREKPALDGAEPSGNSVQALNLLRLHGLTGADRYRLRAEATLRALGQRLDRAPASLADLLLAVDFQLDTPKEVVIVVPGSRVDAEPLLARLRATFLPNRVLSVVAAGDAQAHARLVPLVEGKVARDGRATAYVCEKRVCRLPTSDPEVFAGQLRKVEPLPARR